MSDSNSTPNWQVDRITVGRYGGDPDKRDTSTEIIPYAWGVYMQLIASRGSAYSQSRDSLVQV
jgi:hypothetical protein